MSMASMLGKMVVAGLVAKGVGKLAGGNAGGIAGALSGMLGSGGAAGALGSLLGGGGSSAGGGLGGLLNSLSGSSSQQSQGGGGIGDLLSGFMGDQNTATKMQATAEQDEQAEVLLRAMLNAAKADGEIDKAEQARIIKHLDDVSAEEEQFLKTELSSPLDTEGFIRSVPRGMEQQVYLMSLTAIDLDSKVEAQYLHQLAQGLRIEQQVCNAIHDQVGAPKLYS